jgi:hypothetical protein
VRDVELFQVVGGLSCYYFHYFSNKQSEIDVMGLYLIQYCYYVWILMNSSDDLIIEPLTSRNIHNYFETLKKEKVLNLGRGRSALYRVFN